MSKNKLGATHERKGHRIKDLATDLIVDYDSVNAAKRASRKLQAGGATGKEAAARLGLGAVKVVS